MDFVNLDITSILERPLAMTAGAHALFHSIELGSQKKQNFGFGSSVTSHGTEGQ
jgi:hypothetical protein